MRSTENKLVWFPFNTGMHQEFGARGAPPGTLYTVTNSRLETDGSLVKRDGMAGVATSVPSSTPQVVGDGTTYAIEKPRFLTTVGDTQIIGSTNGDVFARNTISSEFVFSGRCSTALPVRKRKGDVGGTRTGTLAYNGKQPGIAVNSDGYILIVSLATANVARIFVETPDGARLLVQRVNGVTQIRCLAVGSTFYVIWQNSTTGILASAVSLTTGIGAGTSVGTLSSSAHFWDVSAYDGTHWYLVHQSGAATMRIDRFAGTTSNSNVTFAVTGTCPVSLFGSSTQSQVWVGYYNDPTVTGDVRYRVYSGALVSVGGETTIVSAADIYGPPLFGEYYDADLPGQLVACLYVYRVVNSTGNQLRAMGVGVAYSDGTAATTPVLTYHCLPISKPDNYNRVWVQLCPPGGSDATLEQGRALLVRYNQRTAGSSVFPTIEIASPPTPWLGTTNGPDANQNRFHAAARNSTRSYWVFPQVISNKTDAPLVAATVYEYTVSDQEPSADTEKLAVTTAIAGSPSEAFGYVNLPSSALTEGVAEIGFVHRPVIVSLTQTAGSGIAAGTYSYRATYEWVDMDGRLHQSEPSLPVSITVTELDDVAVVVTTTHLTQRREATTINDLTVRLWRTVNGGTTYHSVADSATASGTTAAGVATITDSAADSSIADNAILYTDGGVLANTLAPSCRFFAKSEERLWCGGLWDTAIIECSKVFVPGEPAQFTNDATHQVVLAGACTGLAYMDGNVVAFTEDEIYLISGDGPNDQGIGSFPPPRKMAQGVGCIDYRSVVETNVGTFFQSRRGIELLPRGFGPVQYVGKAVKDLFQSSSLVNCLGSGVYLGKKYNLARFLMTTAGATGGTNVLTYDVDRGEWFQDTIAQEMGVIGVWPDGFAFASSTLSSVLYTHPIWYDNGSQVGDGSANDYVTQSIAMARIYPFPGGPGGWGTVNKAILTMEAVGASQRARLTAATDGNTAQTPSPFWLVTNDATLHWREIMLKVRQCSSVSITVGDTAVSPATSGVKFLGVTIEIEPSGGVHLVASGERI